MTRIAWAAAALLWAGAALAGPWPEIDRAPAALGGGENDAAVVVGVEDYAYLADVPGAGRNAKAWYEYLVRARKVPVGHVALLLDREGTNTKVRRAVAEAAAQVKPGGTLWFVFIGHGAPAKDGGDGLLVGVDAQVDEVDFTSRSVSRRDLLAEMAKARGARPVAVLDTCFSGLDGASRPLMPGTQFVVNPQALSAGLAGVAGVTVLSAGRADEIAGPLPGEERPAFSYLVLGALRGWGDADGDGRVTAREAADYAGTALRLLAKGRSQRPSVSGEDAPLTPKLPKTEAGPDLAGLVVALAGGAATAPRSDAFTSQLAELERAAREREAAEAREREARERATAAHRTQADADWQLLQRFAGASKGPEAVRAVEAFVAKYDAHPLGNPRAVEARALLQTLNGPPAALVEWVTLPGGTFTQGTDDSWLEERPAHRVTVPAFQLARTEVTVEQYRACVEARACTAPATTEGCNWGVAGREKHPVNCVDWRQARAFATWVGGRLPTETEWEFAARSGAGLTYPWGEEEATCARVVMDDDHAGDDGCGRKGTWPVCSKPAGNSRQGLCDLAGSLEEWTEDCEAGYAAAPTDGRASTGGDCQRRMLRGGNWFLGAGNVRAAFRSGGGIGDQYSGYGFRPARSVP